MCFFKIFLLETIGICFFRISRIVFAACGFPLIIITHLLIIGIIQQVFAGQPPQVKQRIGLAMEAENIRLELFLRMWLASMGDCFASIVLICFPVKEIRRIQLGDIKVGEGQSLLVVKHAVICSNSFNSIQIFNQLCNSRIPIRERDFLIFQTFKINRTLACIVCSIENCGDAENLRNEIGRTLVDLAMNIHNLPSQIINQRLGDCNILLHICRKLCGIRKGRSLTIQNQVILSTLIKFGHRWFPSF